MARVVATRIALAIGAACVAVALLTARSYQHDLREARARIATGSQVADTACGPVEYAIAGDGPTVLVVHGAGGGFDQGMALGSALVAKGFRVVAMSRFGYLRTPLPDDASAQAQADAHACLLDALGIQRVAIVGVSAGAPSSLQFALRHPRRTSALVLLVPAIYAPRPGDAPSLTTPKETPVVFDSALKSDLLFWAATRVARRPLQRAILATPPEVLDRAGAAENARATRLLHSILPVTARRAGLLNDARVTSSLPRYDLERVAVPTLAISARDDLFGTWDGARYSARHIPRARFIGYASGGHLWIGHHEDVVDAMSRFVAQAR